MTTTPDDIIPLDQLYRDLSVKALNRACCNKRAAQLLGVSPRILIRWKVQYGIVWDKKEGRWVVKQEGT